MTVLLDFCHVFFNGMEQSHNFFNRRGSSTMEIFFWNGDIRGKIPGIFFLSTVEIMIILITWTAFLYSQCFSVYREKWIFSLNFLSRSNNVMETFMMVIFFQMTSCNILSGYFMSKTFQNLHVCQLILNGKMMPKGIRKGLNYKKS